MKRLVIVLIVAILLCSCLEQQDTQYWKNEHGFINNSIVVEVVDGCEYVCLLGRNGVAITHKQNCKNPIHK